MDKQLTVEQMNTAMQTPEHLKRWLRESGRAWLVFKSDDLVDALKPWPEAMEVFLALIDGYRGHRMAVLSGRTEKVKNLVTGKVEELAIPKTDVLEIDELDRCIRFLIGQATSIDEKWSLGNPAL